MERFAQYLDDLEDFCYAVALLAEKARKFLSLAIFLVAYGLFLYLVISLALLSPPLAMAVASLLVVGFLYFGATGRFRSRHI